MLPATTGPVLGDVERQTYESIPLAEDGHRPRGVKFLRYFVTSAFLVGLALFAVDALVDHLISGSEAHSDADTADVRGVVGLIKVEPSAGCPDDGSVCVCSSGYIVQGKDKYGDNNIVELAGGTACQPFKFKVGDMLFVDKPNSNDHRYWQADMVAKFTGSNVVHNAIVIEVPPEGTPQTADTIKIVEALKGNWKRVLINKFSTLVTRYPFGGVAIRRVDAAKYPTFFSPETQAAITAWGHKIVGEPFDRQMVNPAKKMFDDTFIAPKFVNADPLCTARRKGDDMYSKGGPHKWICSQLIAWTIAFPGGLNLGPGGEGGLAVLPDGIGLSKCPPKWVIQDLQPNPGDWLKEGAGPFLDPNIQWRMPCAAAGCFLGDHGAVTPAPKSPPALPKVIHGLLGSVEYVGCYEDAEGRYSGWQHNSDIRKCGGESLAMKDQFFGVTSPESFHETGKAMCISMASVPPAEQKKVDRDCMDETDKGKPLGGKWRISVYKALKKEAHVPAPAPKESSQGSSNKAAAGKAAEKVGAEKAAADKAAADKAACTTTFRGTFVDNTQEDHAGLEAVKLNDDLFAFYKELEGVIKMVGVDAQGQLGYPTDSRYFAASLCSQVDDKCISDQWASASKFPNAYMAKEVQCKADEKKEAEEKAAKVKVKQEAEEKAAIENKEKEAAEKKVVQKAPEEKKASKEKEAAEKKAAEEKKVAEAKTTAGQNKAAEKTTITVKALPKEVEAEAERRKQITESSK